MYMKISTIQNFPAICYMNKICEEVEMFSKFTAINSAILLAVIIVSLYYAYMQVPEYM